MAERTFLLGAEPDLELRTAETVLGTEEGVILCTDGATDVRRSGALLGVDGLSGMLTSLVRLPAGTMAPRIEEAILAWTDEPIHDDLCLLILKPRSAPG